MGKVRAAVLGGSIGVVLAGAQVLAALPVQALPMAPALLLGAPTITAPTAGATVSGEAVTVSANAPLGATAIRFDIDGRSYSADVSGGAASISFDSYGVAGPLTIAAHACDGGGCAENTSDSVDVTVDNGTLVLDRPAANDVLGDPFTASATTTGGSVRMSMDGYQVAVLTAPPYSVEVSPANTGGHWTDGSHVFAAQRCSADLQSCEPAVTASFTLRSQLHPTVSVGSARISPNQDGRRDSTSVDYVLDSRQQVSWSVLDAADAVVRGPVEVGTLPAGSWTFRYDGRDDTGSPLPSGRYLLRLETQAPLSDGGTVTGSAEAPLIVDLNPPRAVGGSASWSTFYPVADRYRDTVTLGARLRERTTSRRIEVFAPGGALVRRIAVPGRGTGWHSASFDGRRPDGSLLPEGTYRFRMVARDLAGNDGRSRTWSFDLSHKKLVRRTASATLTPNESLVDVAIGSCSRIRLPARSDWPGSFRYMSNYDRCSGTTQGEDLAVSRHTITVRRAARYGVVRVSAYGGRATSRRPGTAFLGYLKASGAPSDFGTDLAATTGWHAAPKAALGGLKTRSRAFRWIAGTYGTSYYAIRSFRVSYVYFVLR